MPEDFFNDWFIFYQGHHRLLLLHNRHTVLPVHQSYLRTKAGAKHGIDFVDLLDQSCPGSFSSTREKPEDEEEGLLDHVGHAAVDFSD